MGEDTTPEKATELALDEAGQADPVSARGGRGEEGLQVLPVHSVQDRVGGSAWDVGSHGARPSGFRAVAATRPQGARTTSPGSPRRRGATLGATERCRGPSLEPLAVTDDCGPLSASRWETAASKYRPGHHLDCGRARLAQPGGRWCDRGAAPAAARR